MKDTNTHIDKLVQDINEGRNTGAWATNGEVQQMINHPKLKPHLRDKLKSIQADEVKPSYIHCEVTRDTKALVTTAASEHGKKRTGKLGKLTPWLIEVVVNAALKELNISSLQAWIDKRNK